MAELTAEAAYKALPLVFRGLAEARGPNLDSWFNWLRHRLTAETAAEKDAEIARLTKDRDTWKANHDEMVARNKLLRDRPDITPEQYAQRMGWHDKLCEEDAEIARLKTELAAATQAKLVAKPKPRRTGGQKVFEARYPDHDWELAIHSERSEWQASAARLGIPDDPQPPTDGELLEKAHDEAATNADWAAVAAEFLRLRAERDGGEA